MRYYFWTVDLNEKKATDNINKYWFESVKTRSCGSEGAVCRINEPRLILKNKNKKTPSDFYQQAGQTTCSVLNM